MEGAHLASIGEQYDLTYPAEHLGEGAQALTKVLKGSPILKRLQEAKYPAIIVGPGLLNRPDRAAVLQQVTALALPEAVKALWKTLHQLMRDSVLFVTLQYQQIPYCLTHAG